MPVADDTTTIDFRLPSLGSDMDDGTIIEWTVAVGDSVTKGDTLLAVETEKGDIDVETWDSGVITEICAEPGTRVPVGTVIARIATAGGHSPASEIEPPPDPTPTSAPAPPPATPPATRVVVSASPARGAERPTVSPRLVYWPTPAGPTADPTAAAPRPRDDGWDRIADPMRRAIARTMSRANREIPHYHVQQTIDLGAGQRWLTERNENAPVAERVVMAALLTKATARAARAVPELNGHWTDEGLQPAADVNISLIVRRRDGGVVAPVLHRADQLDVAETMSRLTDLSTRAKSDDLTSADLAGATITITNLGDRGVDAVLGVIQPPQVALVGFGRTDLRPVVADGAVAARTTVIATLSGDHRASDGQTAARFLRTLDRALQEPETL